MGHDFFGPRVAIIFFTRLFNSASVDVEFILSLADMLGVEE